MDKLSTTKFICKIDECRKPLRNNNRSGFCCACKPKDVRRAEQAARHRERMATDPEYRKAKLRDSKASKARHPEWKKKSNDRKALLWQDSAEHREQHLARKRQRDYGWEPGAVEAARELQSGKCAICEIKMLIGVSKTDLRAECADHREDTEGNKHARALLCRQCNRDLGTYERVLPHHEKFDSYLIKYGHDSRVAKPKK